MEYIASYHLHSQLKEKLMKKETVLMDTFVHSPDFIFNYPDKSERLFKAYRLLEQHREQWPLLKDMLLFPQMIESFLAFIEKLKLYQLPITSLPQSSEMNQTIQEITHLLWDLVDEPKKLTNKHQVIPHFLDHASYVYTQKHHINLPITSTPKKHIELYFAQNKRQEIEAVIQDIILKNEQHVAFVVPNKKEYLPLIESIVHRYGQKIDLQDRSQLLFKNKLLAFLNFMVMPKQRHFIKALENNSFLLRYPSDYITYIKHFELEFQTLPKKLDLAQDEKKTIFKIQSRIQDDHDKVMTIIEKVNRFSYQEIHQYVYDFYLQEKKYDLTFYRNFLVNYQTFLEKRYHPVIMYLLDRSLQKEYIHPHFQVYDYQSLPLEFNGTIYFLSLNAQNFPAIQEEKGLIDEHYLKQVDNYPSQNIRSEYLLKQKRWIYTLGSRQVFSYVLANYEGKALEPAFEILNYAETHQVERKMWPLQERKNAEDREEKLSEKIAEELFLDKQILYASVSSLQKYANDPILYFKEYGLKVREDIEPSFNALVLGNLNHALMENHDFQKEWYEVMKSFPHHSLWMDMIQTRYQIYLDKNIEYLKNALESTSFKPSKLEFEIRGNDLHEKIHLKGFIDRIDISEENKEFIIIDYKTSEKNLRWGDLVMAKDLQLLTYAALFSKQNKLAAHAAFYYAFNHPNAIHDQAFHYTATKGMSPVDIDPSEEWNKAKRFSGWYFTEPLELYDHPDFWKGLRETKTKGIQVNARNAYRFDSLKEFLKNRYEKIYKLISSGQLNIYEIEKELELDASEEAKWKEVIQ